MNRKAMFEIETDEICDLIILHIIVPKYGSIYKFIISKNDLISLKEEIEEYEKMDGKLK